MTAWRLVLLAALPALVGVSCGEVVSARAGPAFLPTRRALRAPAGGDVALVCRVENIGDRTVSWVRGRDLQILAHAGAVFSADPRVAAAAEATGGGATHTLRLRGLRAADAGRYECQLNTDPKLSQTYNLTVTAEGEMPRVEVWAEGEREVRARAGGVASLACAARVAPVARDRDRDPDPAPLRLAWFKDGQPLLPQGGVSLDTERGAGGAASRLALALGALGPRAAGVYTCRARAQPEGEGEPPIEGEVHFKLHVLQHDDAGAMEAMQRDQSLPGGGGVGGGGGGGARRAATAPALLAALLAALLVALLTS